MIIASLAAFAAFAILAAIVFRAAVHALPVLVAIASLQGAQSIGLSMAIAIIAALAIGAVVHLAGCRIVSIEPRALRIAMAAAFVLPAVYAGYAVSASVLAFVGITGLDADALAASGGLIVGASALAGLDDGEQRKPLNGLI